MTGGRGRPRQAGFLLQFRRTVRRSAGILCLRLAARHLLLCLPLLVGLAAGAQAQTLSISAPADANEGNSGTRNLRFTVTLSSSISSPVSFQVCFSGTATIDLTGVANIPASADYQPTGNNSPQGQNCILSVINSGSTSSTYVGIRIKGDTEQEPDETVIGTLSLTGTPPAA